MIKWLAIKDPEYYSTDLLMIYVNLEVIGSDLMLELLYIENSIYTK